MILNEKSRFFRGFLRLLNPDHVSAREAVEATQKTQEKEKVPRPRKKGLEDLGRRKEGWRRRLRNGRKQEGEDTKKT